MGKFSETLMDHVTSPRNSGVMADPDLTGLAGSPGRGAFLVLYLKIQDGRISAAQYQTYGCGPTIAAGSMLTEMILGRTIGECRILTAEDLIRALDGVPPDKVHCPALAIAALGDALKVGSGEWRVASSEGKEERGQTRRVRRFRGSRARW
jgi:nitrogen fixation NifU-like protein